MICAVYKYTFIHIHSYFGVCNGSCVEWIDLLVSSNQNTGQPTPRCFMRVQMLKVEKIYNINDIKA